MFIPQRVFDILINALDQGHRIALGAKECEIEVLTRTISDLAEQLKYERARADSLVDRLLVRDARVAAVAPVAIDAAKHKDAEAVKKLTEIFDSMNEMGVDVPAPEQRAFEIAGGTAISSGPTRADAR